jgi:hypothetical protein
MKSQPRGRGGVSVANVFLSFLTWQAGPLTKGSNLCHGTGGNGYAFLKLHRRFGDKKWLERARAFAMHGMAQTEADLATHGHLRG